MEAKSELNALRQLFQDLLAPEVREIRGDLKASDAKLGAKIDVTSNKVESLENKLGSKIGSVENKLEAKIGSVEAKLEAKIEANGNKIESLSERLDQIAESLRSEIKSSSQIIVSALQNASLRGQLDDKNEISDLRERVTRLEERLQAKH